MDEGTEVGTEFEEMGNDNESIIEIVEDVRLIGQDGLKQLKRLNAGLAVVMVVVCLVAVYRWIANRINDFTK